MIEPRVSLVIPANNEQEVIGRLLRTLVEGVDPGSMQIIVVANGCTDGTVEVASAEAKALSASGATPIRIVSIPDPSKWDALRVGDDLATVYPRLWVDADVVIGGGDVLALCEALEAPGILAAAPTRRLELQGRSWVVRWYYEVWERLPQVSLGLFGRGVVAMTAEGHARVKALPPVMGDDLAVSLAFSPAERVIVVGSNAAVHTPRTATDLVRRRTRVSTGSAHVYQEVAPRLSIEGDRGPANARTRCVDLFRIARAEPTLIPKVATFLVIGAIAQWRSRMAVRRGDFTTWLRDESSRAS